MTCPGIGWSTHPERSVCPGAGGGDELQKALLESEGVFLSRAGRIDLDTYLWIP